MYKNKLKDGFERLSGIEIPTDKQSYVDTGSNKGTIPELTMTDLFKGIWEALKISGEASRVIWKEAKSEIGKKYSDTAMKIFGLSPDFMDMLSKYGERKSPDQTK